MKFATIREHAEDYPIAWMCRRLNVSTSGYYAWRTRSQCPRKKRDDQLTLLVRAVHVESRKTYGSPRVYRELRKRWQRVARKRIARLMRQKGL